MNRYIIADPHFGHTNIIKYENRPFKDVFEMDETLIQNWNRTVYKDDFVYVLGDFTLSRSRKIIKNLLERLNGHKILIMGNHDRLKPKDYVLCGFETAFRKTLMIEPGVILMHEPYQDQSLINKDLIYFFGHVHAKHTLMDEYPNCKCVSVERTNYFPVDFDQLLKEMKLRNSKEFQRFKEIYQKYSNDN